MDDHADFREWVRAELTARLQPRSADATTSVLGAGSDDLEAGRVYLAALAPVGLSTPTWPRECGGLGATLEQAAIVCQELTAFAVPDLYPWLVGIELVGPTLLAHGTPEQCARWLPAIADGSEIWCQLFSEPDAGSDLAGLTCTARRDGEEPGGRSGATDGVAREPCTWVVAGQKVWTSRGHYSKWGLLLARHDGSVPKHRGITAFGIDMELPGVGVRPLRQMNGDAHFTEVFLDNARVPDADRIAPAGDGWRVALTCLGFERGAVGGGRGGGFLDPTRLIALAREKGRLRDPIVRDALARLFSEARVAGWAARRGGHGSASKLRGSALFRSYTDLAAALLGPEAMCEPGGEWQTLLLTAPSISIRGGTDEIQRNIIGERVLGLTQEPRVDRELPFDQLARSRSGRPPTQ